MTDPPVPPYPLPGQLKNRPATGLDLAATADQLFVSYAQNGEDVLLWRVLGSVEAGFYIDAGACHPVTDSVTQAFYERGWRGINVEPVPEAATAFPPARPRDVNLRVALSDRPGTLPFYEVEGTGLSTLSAESAAHQRRLGRRVLEHEVEVTTLAEVCRQHAPPVVHFLKVDVEGLEESVLRGADFQACQPWLILVEATVPNSTISTHRTWEPILTRAGYEFLYFDGLNRYYASASKAAAFRPHFQTPANPMDCFQTHREQSTQAALEQARRQQRKLAQTLEKTQARLAELTAFRKALLQHHRVPAPAPRALRLGLKLARLLRKLGLG